MQRLRDDDEELRPAQKTLTAPKNRPIIKQFIPDIYKGRRQAVTENEAVHELISGGLYPKPSLTKSRYVQTTNINHQ